MLIIIWTKKISRVRKYCENKELRMRSLYFSLSWELFQSWKEFTHIIKGGSLVRLLQLSKDEYVEIAQVWLQPNSSISALEKNNSILKVIPITDPSINPVTILVKGINDPIVKMVLEEFNCVFNDPVTFDEHFLNVSLIGDEEEIGNLVKFLQTNIPKGKWKILSISSFSTESANILQKLTKKQREAVIQAYKNGYYEIPHRINISELAKKMDVSTSTFSEHLRKAEQKLVGHVLEGLSNDLYTSQSK